jgi:uncharacterized Rossmann fold enzyme
MNFHDWEPVYERILADFGFDRAGDERARDLLADLLADSPGSAAGASGDGADASDAGEPLAPTDLDFAGETVAVAGAGPSLADDHDLVRAADSVVAASDAATRLREAGVGVDAMVTDLDEEGDIAARLTREGTPVAVHAHGDNESALRQRVPGLSAAALLPTTQAAPVAGVSNTGGFTDGDRAAFLADHCGAAELVFAGWDFDDPDVGPMKAKKLVWAERLLRWLERRRGERFEVLDGRRDGIDESALPA